MAIAPYIQRTITNNTSVDQVYWDYQNRAFTLAPGESRVMKVVNDDVQELDLEERVPDRVVGSRAAPWGVQDTYTTLTCCTSRTKHQVNKHCTNIRLVYSGLKSLNAFVTPSEVGMGNTWEVKASIHLISSGIVEEAKIAVRFNGKRLALVPNGGVLVSDPISINLPKGKRFFVYTFANRLISTSYTEAGGETGLMVATGANFPRDSRTRSENGVSVWELGSGTQFSSSTGIDPFTLDKTDGDYAGLTIQNVLTVGPIAILGDELNSDGQASIGLMGDSILAGAGDLPRADSPFSGMGYFQRLLNGDFPYFQASLGGDGATYKVGLNSYNFALRWRFIEKCDILVIALGTNDLISGISQGAVRAAIIEIATQAKARGIKKVVVITLLPRTTSTGGWVTLEDQTVTTTFNFHLERASLNAWLKSLPSPIDDCIDVTTAVEDAATGKWKAASSVVNCVTTTGSSTTVINLASPTLVASAHIGKQLVIGSETRQITANTTNTVTVSAAFGGAPSTDVAVKIAEAMTVDGTHPAAGGHNAMGAVIEANRAIFVL